MFQLLMLNNEIISALFYLSSDVILYIWKSLSYCTLVSLYKCVCKNATFFRNK